MRLRLWMLAVTVAFAFDAYAAQKESASGKGGFVRPKLRSPAAPIEDLEDRRRDAGVHFLQGRHHHCLGQDLSEGPGQAERLFQRGRLRKGAEPMQMRCSRLS
jgi:hypothetical protein